MKKAIVVMAFAAIMALALTGCGGSASSAASIASESTSASSTSASSAATVDKFDGSAFADTGDGEMVLYTAGGTSENGNVPQVALDKNVTIAQIEVDYANGDGSVVTVYVDGIENTKMNAGEYLVQNTITLQGEALDEGVHTVEVVAMDGDTPTIYKKAQFEIVK